MMRHVFKTALVALTAVTGILGTLGAQTTTGTAPLRVFLDCHQSGCGSDFFITEMPYVSFTRDRMDAVVYLQVTALMTGASGSQYTLTISGLGPLAAAPIPSSRASRPTHRRTAGVANWRASSSLGSSHISPHRPSHRVSRSCTTPRPLESHRSLR